MSFEKRKTLTGLEKLVYEVKGEMEKVLAAVSIFLQGSEFTALEFYSSLYGVVLIQLQKKVFITKAWESEEVAQELSGLNYHYTGKILESITNNEAATNIIVDCFSYIQEPTVKNKVLEILKQNNFQRLVEILAK